MTRGKLRYRLWKGTIQQEPCRRCGDKSFAWIRDGVVHWLCVVHAVDEGFKRMNPKSFWTTETAPRCNAWKKGEQGYRHPKKY